MKILITNKQQDIEVDRRYFEKVLKTLALQFKSHFDEMSLHFVSEKKIKDLHKQFFDDPTITDCITLPIDPPNTKPYCVLGEVFVCPSVAKTYAKEHNGDSHKELTLYVIHGFLHLIGYDDMNEKDEKLMRDAEILAFKYLEKEGLC